MCEWISKTFPWCVEHIGNMSLTGQIFVAIFILFLMVSVYVALYNAVYSIRENGFMPRRRKAAPCKQRKPTIPNNFNFLARYLADSETYDSDWMDADSWEETR